MIITTNGTHTLLDNPTSNTHVILISGTLGGAAVQLAYRNSNDTLVNFTDGNLSINSQYKLEHGFYRDVFAVVTGATGTTSIDIEASGIL